MPQKIILHEIIDPSRIVDVKATDKPGVLAELAELLSTDPNVLDSRAFLEAIIAREKLGSTGVGLGVAIPHVKIPEVRDYAISVGRSRAGIDFDSHDAKPAHLIFMIAASETQTREFVKMLARVNRLLRFEANRTGLMEADIPDGFLDIIRRDDLGES